MTEAADAREPRKDQDRERDFGDSAGYGGGSSALDQDCTCGAEAGWTLSATF